MNDGNPVARAFELARNGQCKDVVDLERRLTLPAVTLFLAIRSLFFENRERW